MTNDDVLLRPYDIRDRAALRRIAADTADAGRPVENFFPDREFIADLVTAYYTDVEPGSTWVACAEGAVVGYVTGCLDTRAYLKGMRRVTARAFLAGAGRGLLLKPAAWLFVRANLRTWRAGGNYRTRYLDAYPAHFHVNITAEHRGHHVGRRLIEKFMAQTASAGAAGIHVATRTDNGQARHLFESLQFQNMGESDMYLPSGKEERAHGAGRITAHRVVIYGKKLP